MGFETTARGLVGDIDRFAVHDGPGIRTAVFLKGCPLHCEWCHSPETQSFTPELLFIAQKCSACGLCLSVCEQGALSPAEIHLPLADESLPALCQVAVDWQKCTHCGGCAKVCYTGALKISGTWMSAAELIAEVEKDCLFFAASGGGVTLTGGEATAQPTFSRQFLAGCRSAGIHTALETNGCAPWRVFEELLEFVDLFLYDIKQMDEASHRELTGASNQLLLDNLHRLAEHGANVIVRVPCIPGLNDTPENIAATAVYVRQVGLETIHLLPYNRSAGAKYHWLGRDYSLKQPTEQSHETMARLAEICRSHGLNAQVGG
jgi:pyruvate formate lyase activating enzyme